MNHLGHRNSDMAIFWQLCHINILQNFVTVLDPLGIVHCMMYTAPDIYEYDVQEMAMLRPECD